MNRGESSKRALPWAGGSGGRIGALPDGVLGHVLGFLEAPEAVRTCLLARRWRHLWKSATSVSINRYGDHNPPPVVEVRDFLDHLLLLRGGSPLDICRLALGEVEDTDMPQVEFWVRHAVMCQARVLTVHISSYNRLELEDLPFASRHLTTLNLHSVHVCNSFLNFSSCPSLENLAFQYCEISSANMISKSLKYLSIINSTINMSTEYFRIRTRIHAPNLVSLYMVGPRGFTPILDSIPSLEEAYVWLDQECEDICGKLFDPNFSHCDCEFCHTSANIGDGDDYSVLLKGLSEAETLELSSETEMFIFKRDLRWCPMFGKLKTLILNYYWCMHDDFSALACILEHSPVLKKLTLDLVSQGEQCKVEIKGSFKAMERSAKISEHLSVVQVNCQAVDERVLNVLKFLCSFNICFMF